MASNQNQPFFKKYVPDEFISSSSQCKSSVARQIRARVLQDYPGLEDHIEDLMPKKASLVMCKGQNHVSLILDPNNEVIFYQHRDSPWFPTLRLVHRFPLMGATWMVDQGAIPHVLNGSHIFTGGLRNPNARMDVDLPVGSPVIIMAEGKMHACCIGLVKMTRDEIRDSPKGIGVENVHYLNDGLWIAPNYE